MICSIWHHRYNQYMRLVPTLLLMALVVGGVWFGYTVSNPPYPEVAELGRLSEPSFQDLSDYFRELAEKKGAPYAFEVLRRATLPPDTDPHLLGHLVGDMLYKQQGIGGIARCTDDFRNACSHSVVIGILSEHGEGSLPEIAKTCREAPGGTGAYTMCYHGLGHGVLAYVGYDLEAAVGMCETMGTPEYRNREYIECVGGAVMEMIAGVHDPLAWERQFDTYFKESDPLYPCDAAFMPEATRDICYTYLTPHLFTATGGLPESSGPHDYRKAFALCESISEARLQQREACFGGFGKEFVALANGRDIRDVGRMEEPALRDVRTWCSQAGSEDAEAACNTHALSSLFWGGESIPDAAFSFCAIAEGKEQTRCYWELSEKIQYYLEGTVRGYSLCARLPEAFRIPCGARSMF